MSDDADAWHLPDFMRDFHAQKLLFRTIDAADGTLRSDGERERYPRPNWVDAHVYTVDVFLRFMAEHGYTLQRCRRDMKFKDITRTLDDAGRLHREQSAAVLRSIISK